MGDIAVITSGKGGTGKSTVCAACGSALARRGKTVLLIDADAGLRSLDLMLSISEETVYDLSDIFAGNCEPIKAIRSVPACWGLYVLPAPQSAGAYCSIDDMKRLCNRLSTYYDYILIDSPAGLDECFQLAICSAAAALIVTNPDPISIRDAQKVHRLLRERGIANNRLIINRYKANAIKSGLVRDLDEVIDGVGVRLIGIIPDDEKFVTASILGTPFSGKSPAALAFSRLAARIDGEDIPLAKL